MGERDRQAGARRRTAIVRAFAGIAVAAAAAAALTASARETAVVVNPVARQPAAIERGRGLFRLNCAPCHGPGATGGTRGPSLVSRRFTHGSGDGDLFRTITHGVPGTAMPANDVDDVEAWSVVAYLRSLSPPPAPPAGDPRAGALAFKSLGCPSCHLVHGQGGVLGPELSRVGAERSPAYLAESIRTPNAALSVGPLDPNDHYALPLVYDTVRLVTADGREIRGVALNEDTFSVQIIDTAQQTHSFVKRELREFAHENVSLMPAFPESVLPDAALTDLVAYLESLR
jgi:putative heme-binding domain-containing protein